MSFFLVSFSSFSLLIFLQAKIIGARRSSETTYLPGLLRPTREGAQGEAPSAIWESTCGLHGQNPWCHRLYWFSMWTSYNEPLKSLCFAILIADAIILRESLDPTGAGPRYFSFSISPSNEYSGLISFGIDWFGLLAAQGTLKSLLQYYSSKASILRCSAFFMVHFSHPHITIGKTIY